MDAERFLANTISILSASPDFRTTIDNFARLATGGLSDWCGIFMLENEQTVRRLAIAPTSYPEALYPLDLHACSGPGHVVRTGERQLLTGLQNHRHDIAGPLGLKPEELVLPNGAVPSIYLCTPVVARNRIVGAMVFMSAGRESAFDESEIRIATSLADAAAVAIDSAKLSRDAKETNRLKDEFVGMVSHELKTPLTPILGCIHLLRSTKLSPTNFDRALEMIERNANAQVQIVEDLLDASRIVSGKLHLTMKTTYLIPILEMAIESVRAAAEAKHVQIVTKFADVRQPIDGDPHRLQQIVWNLLSNAVKFTPSDGRIEISIASKNDQAEIEVMDTGIGIPADQLPYIFNRFHPGYEGRCNTRTGLGLGLAIVHHLVELHSGSIEAASAGPGQGAVFTLRFPFAAHKAAAMTNSG